MSKPTRKRLLRHFRLRANPSEVREWTDRPYFGDAHRKDGPAREYDSGHKEWLVDGKLHRKHGPAIESIDGHREWWRHGDKRGNEMGRSRRHDQQEG